VDSNQKCRTYYNLRLELVITPSRGWTWGEQDEAYEEVSLPSGKR